MNPPRSNKLIRFDEITRGMFAYLKRASDEGFRWDDKLIIPESALESTNWNKGPWLVPCNQNSLQRRYPPLRYHNLHKHFANLSGTLEAIQNFANKYGLLTGGVFLYHPEYQRQLVRGESLFYWQNEIQEMSFLVGIWHIVKEGKSARIREHVVLRKSDSSLCFDVNWKAEKRYSEAISENLEYWRDADERDVALYFIDLQINKQLEGQTSPALMFYRNSIVRFIPHSLKAALYILFALEISNYQVEALYPEKECECGCGKTFLPKKPWARFYSPRCKSKQHYYNSPNSKRLKTKRCLIAHKL